MLKNLDKVMLNVEGETVSPLVQFEIKNILRIEASIFNNLSISLTNIVLYLTISLGLIMMWNKLSINNNKIVSNNWSINQETAFASVLSIVINQINAREGQKYFPFVFTLFLFVLINNLIGLIPYSFATTSHFCLVLSLSFIIVLGSTILGLVTHKLKFFALFVPAGTPLALLPLLVMIETISYIARHISLGLRLGANIFSGHMLLTILSGFTYKIMSFGFIQFIIGFLPLTFIIAFTGLEFAIAFIQALVFIILTCSYIRDGLDLH